MANHAWKRNVQSLHSNCTLIDCQFIVTTSGSVAIPINYNGSGPAGQTIGAGSSTYQPQQVVGGTGATVSAVSFGPEVFNVTNPASGVYSIFLNSAYPNFKFVHVEPFGTPACAATSTGSAFAQIATVSGFNSSPGTVPNQGFVTIFTGTTAGTLAQPYAGIGFSVLIEASNSGSQQGLL